MAEPDGNAPALTEPTALYRFYDANDQLLYIGVSLEIAWRWRSHSRTKPWWTTVARATIDHYDTRRGALAAERAAIKAERPLWNVTHNQAGVAVALKTIGEAATQLTDDLGNLAARVGAVLGTDLQLACDQRARDRAHQLVGELADGEHPDATADDLLALLWPDDPPLDWWRSPLGLLVAPTAAQEDAPGWTRAEAAEVLGVTTGTVAQLGARGSLDTAVGGGFSRRSVLTRLVRLHEREESHAP